MGIEEEIESLRHYLDALARNADTEWTKPYALTSPARPPGLYWQARWMAGRLWRWLESVGIFRSDPWPVSLKQSGTESGARPLVIWAVGVERDKLRMFCSKFCGLANAFPDLAPVLITDVADFRFFSRLGWLVEYLPRLAGDGEPYELRKAAFLARLYRGAPALPVSAGLNWQQDDIRRWLSVAYERFSSITEGPGATSPPA